MTIEISLLISGVAVAVSIYLGITSNRRSQKTDDKKEASEMTTVIVKLENIGTGIAKIEAKMNSIENDRREDREKLIRLEESVKSAWKRIDLIEKNKGSGEPEE
jgi:peptidoglycan hydrolase CwlO-like protein